MIKDNMNISSIETFLNSVLYKKASENIFFGGLPRTINSTWTDLIVVDCSTTLTDMNAYGKGVVTLLLYPSKNKSDGTKNIPVLSRLEKAVNKAIEEAASDNFAISRMGVMSDYDVASSIHHNVVFLNITIV